MRNRISLFVLLLFFVVGIANGAIVANLNVAQVPVDNTSSKAREATLPSALGQVLVKVSGNPSITTLPAVQNAMDNVDDMIQSYSYLHNDLLQVTFDKKAIQQLLRQAGQASWSANRPLTLMWLNVRDDGGSQILSSSTGNQQLVTAVQQVAKTRGVPVLFPAMDLDDQSLVNTGSDGFDSSLLQKVKKRYDANAVLAGDISQVGSGFKGQWLLLMNGSPYKWNSEADSLTALLQQATNEMVNLMANRLAVSDDKNLQTSVKLTVSNVNGLDDYAKVLAKLRHLPAVEGVSVIDMNGSDLLLQVKTVGGASALSDALSAQSHFVEQQTVDDSARNNAELFYRWVNSTS